MAGRPGWNDEYWKNMDEETAKKLRSRCPRCGSSNTHFNETYGTWRCNKCENIFVIKGLNKKKPWWKRLFGKG